MKTAKHRHFPHVFQAFSTCFGPPKGAKTSQALRLLRRFLEQGSEVLCAAGALDPTATVSVVAMQALEPYDFWVVLREQTCGTWGTYGFYMVLPGFDEIWVFKHGFCGNLGCKL